MTEKRKFRTRSRYEAHNVRIMSIDEPKPINEETTLCSFSVVDQSGSDKDPDTWVRVTAKNGLAERVYNSKVGDRVSFAGKPFVRAYTDKEGVAKATIEVKFPEFIEFLTRLETTEATEEAPAKEEEVVAEAPKRRGRPPGSTKKPDGKTLPFGDE